MFTERSLQITKMENYNYKKVRKERKLMPRKELNLLSGGVKFR